MAGGDRVRRPDRHAALGQAGGDGNARRQQGAGKGAGGRSVGDQRWFDIGAGQPADQIAARLGRQAGNQVEDRLVTRVGMNDPEGRRVVFQPARSGVVEAAVAVGQFR